MSSVSSPSSAKLPATLRPDRTEVSRATAASRLAILGLLMLRLMYALTSLPRDELDIVLVKSSMLVVRLGLRRVAPRAGEGLDLESPLAPPPPAGSTGGEGECAVNDSCGLLLLLLFVGVLCSSFRIPSIMHGLSVALIFRISFYLLAGSSLLKGVSTRRGKARE